VIVFSALFSLLGLMILRINKTTPKANKREAANSGMI